jgi:hypothetical protein
MMMTVEKEAEEDKNNSKENYWLQGKTCSFFY